MAVSKKAVKKKVRKPSKKLRAKRGPACSRGGAEIHAEGSSPRTKRRRSKAGRDLVSCRMWRQPYDAPPARGRKRTAEKNGKGGYSDEATVRDFAHKPRVELHPGTDRWMMGDRFGDVTGINTKTGRVRVKLDRSGKSLWFPPSRLQTID